MSHRKERQHMAAVALAWVVVMCGVCVCNSVALKHDLVITGDTRSAWHIQSFGFEAGGVMDMRMPYLDLQPIHKAEFTPTTTPISAVEAVKLATGDDDGTAAAGKDGSAASDLDASVDEEHVPTGVNMSSGWKQHRVGFLIKETQRDASLFLEQYAGASKCLFDYDQVSTHDVVLMLSNASTDWKDWSWHDVVAKKDVGMFNLFFVNCEPNTQVSFELKVEQYNPGPNYLSSGDMPLPTMYTLFTLVMGAMSIGWFMTVRENRANANRVHHLMSALLVIKALSLGTEALRMHAIASTGDSTGWSVLFYIFTFAKGMLLFTIVLLIGTGWSFIKPFLSQREKRIFALVLPLQVLDNIALIVVQEMAPGSVAWLSWHDMLRVLDVVCCCAILFPIMWSMQHLKQSVGSGDSKEAHNLRKLRLFQQFYGAVVMYIYFTRIILYLLNTTVSFRHTYLHPLFDEVAAVAFYTFLMVKFRPVANNQYFALGQDDGDDIELNNIQGADAGVRVREVQAMGVHERDDDVHDVEDD